MATMSAAHAHPLLVPNLKHVELVVVGAVRAMFRRGRRTERAHYVPPLNVLLEDAAMARELRHL
ncbi:hypothetical protein BST33_14700 [Mycolicibacter minnesotensis]|uniref:Uncharacterized protein n=1 Tax=Mycolicibacter minnesotensis TaxID=1118379 RepID=A0A7I7R7Q3_9MYCO|nr:hypothetical protein [Mycolicibacter minnesotensis]ORA99195.1 hypothetical protein BST33_14700 [Mycolicibacter minnesotensis]BBY34641.1 hypothetical protein MMIN_27020 [Mycolicibacter minnesotensis]